MSTDGRKSVTFGVNFDSDACSEHTSVQSIRRFRAYVGSEHVPVQAYTDSEHAPVQAYKNSEIAPVQAYTGSEHAPVQANKNLEKMSVQANTDSNDTLKGFIYHSVATLE